MSAPVYIYTLTNYLICKITYLLIVMTAYMKILWFARQINGNLSVCLTSPAAHFKNLCATVFHIFLSIVLQFWWMWKVLYQLLCETKCLFQSKYNLDNRMGASQLTKMYFFWNRNAYLQHLCIYYIVCNGWNIPCIIY